MTWEFLYGGKALWMIDCHHRDVQKTMGTFNKMFDIFSGFKAGLATSAVVDKPDGSAIGFQVLCYENEKDTIKAKLKSLGVEDSEMRWLPEAELRRQFEGCKELSRCRANSGLPRVMAKQAERPVTIRPANDNCLDIIFKTSYTIDKRSG